MPRPAVNERDLRRELDEFKQKHPALRLDDCFVLWFVRAFITDDDTKAAQALTGGTGDKGIDAIFVDDNARIVFVVQGKYRAGIGEKSEGRNDVIQFAGLSNILRADLRTYQEYANELAPAVREPLQAARDRLRRAGWRAQFYYVTTGRCSATLVKEAENKASAVEGCSIAVIADKQILLMLADYLDGVAPPVPTLDLDVEPTLSAHGLNLLSRSDPKTGIESWVFSMSDVAVAEAFRRAGIRVFARNVRGFLGSTEINRSMEDTISDEPEFFWYYNNGITIVCDDVESRTRSGRQVLSVGNPQIINGQQTTRALSRKAGKRASASVLVRVIKVPRNGNGSAGRFEQLVSRIVAATNSQNEVRPSDLMSNDRRQIEIERQLRKLGYNYIRKRQTKREARAGIAGYHFHVKKEEIAQAVAACEFDPQLLREGKERLFEERWYPRVFPSADAYFYLSRYWLMREVGYAAKGYRERSYAKWLVLHFVWTKMRGLLASRQLREGFRSAWEFDGIALHSLWQANDSAYRAAMQFYRSKRGVGAKALDASSFFRLTNRHRAFEKFWGTGKNSHRRRFDKSFRKFTRRLSAEAEA